MPYTIPTNLTNGSTGLEQLLIYEAGQVPFLMPGILFSIFIIILSAGYFSQDRRIGEGNFPMWCAIAGLITTTGAFILFLYQNLLNLEVLIICVIITILSMLWLFLSER